MLTGYDAEANAASSPNVTNSRWNSVERVVLKTVAATIRTEEAMTISWKVTRHLMLIESSPSKWSHSPMSLPRDHRPEKSQPPRWFG
jgi:hypothetical protein